MTLPDPSDFKPSAEAPLVNPDDLRKWVLFEDERLLVIDKPGWLVVHPSKNGPWSSLAGAIREGLGIGTIRFVYRLDRETSGVIILAKDELTGSRLQKAVGRRRVGKAYAALLAGELAGTVSIDQALGPDPSAGVVVKQRVVPPGTGGAQESRTIIHPLAVGGGVTLAGVELPTGRKHQIRAHAEWLGHRVIGDKLYGPDPRLYLDFAQNGWTERHAQALPLYRQALHCAAIDLREAGLPQVFRAPWPAELARYAADRLGLAPEAQQQRIAAFVDRLFAARPAGQGVAPPEN